MLTPESLFLNWLFATWEKHMLTTTPAQIVLADAAQAALQAAATNASSTGWKTSEFWVSVASAAAGTAAIAILGASTGGIVSGILGAVAIGYAHSRGNVKAAALAGASAGLAAAAASSNVTAQMAAKVGENIINVQGGSK